MFSRKIEEQITYENDNVYAVYWRYQKIKKPFLVLDENKKLVALLAEAEFNKALEQDKVIEHVSEIANYNFSYICKENDLYMQARNIFAEKNIEYLPVVDKEFNIYDLFSRKRAFYKYYFKNGLFDRMHYASSVWVSAKEAKSLGYDKISVIEFGVAGGNGLLDLQFHAKEIERIFGIKIEVYGFDSGKGMPDGNNDYRNLTFMWGKPGIYKMNFEKLESKLEGTKLVIGNIEESVGEFFECYNPAPIGAIMVDVDYYTSTVPILKMLELEEKKFLPRVYMYFDDILKGFEQLGESLAVKEFNLRNSEKRCISPEGRSTSIDWTPTEYMPFMVPGCKICHLYMHPYYNNYIWEFDQELPLNYKDLNY